jgi:hypothetical protein
MPCRAGEREILPAFSYVPGQPLENYIDVGRLDSKVDVMSTADRQSLDEEQMFQASPDMTCSTCAACRPEPDLATLSQRCVGCHKSEVTGGHPKVGGEIANNCIDCHSRLKRKSWK